MLLTEMAAVVWQAGAFVPGAVVGVVTGGGSDGRFAWFFTQSGNYSFRATVWAPLDSRALAAAARPH